MSTALTDTNISSTYKGVLHVNNVAGGNGIPPTGLTQVYDGLGASTALSIGAPGQGIGVDGPLTIGSLNLTTPPELTVNSPLLATLNGTPTTGAIDLLAGGDIQLSLDATAVPTPAAYWHVFLYTNDGSVGSDAAAEALLNTVQQAPGGGNDGGTWSEYSKGTVQSHKGDGSNEGNWFMKGQKTALYTMNVHSDSNASVSFKLFNLNNIDVAIFVDGSVVYRRTSDYQTDPATDVNFTLPALAGNHVVQVLITNDGNSASIELRGDIIGPNVRFVDAPPAYMP